MAKQVINNLESAALIRSKLNDNFTELYHLTGQPAPTTATVGYLGQSRFGTSGIEWKCHGAGSLQVNGIGILAKTGTTLTITGGTFDGIGVGAKIVYWKSGEVLIATLTVTSITSNTQIEVAESGTLTAIAIWNYLNTEAYAIANGLYKWEPVGCFPANDVEYPTGANNYKIKLTYGTLPNNTTKTIYWKHYSATIESISSLMFNGVINSYFPPVSPLTSTEVYTTGVNIGRISIYVTGATLAAYTLGMQIRYSRPTAS